MKFKSDIEIQAGVNAGGSTGDPGQILSSTGTDGVAWIDQNAIGAATDFVFFNVKNETGSTILKGKGVMAVGTDGNSGHILVDEMVADGTVEPKYFLGVLEEDIANGAFARVISFGQLSQFNTNGQNGETWADGQVLWCDPANPGDFTITEPDGPNVKIAAAFILNKATNGKIQVRVQANEGVHDLHDTKITSQVDGDVLVWDNTTGVWFNDSTLNVDYTNSRVGIGTTSPDYKLDVSAAARAHGVRIGRDFSVASRGTVRIDANGTGSPSDVLFGHTAAANESSWTGVYWSLSSRGTSDNGKFQLWRGSGHTAPYNSELRVLTALPNGNIGIGATDPSEKLNVDGNILATGTIIGSNLSGTNTGDQVLPTDFVSAANGGTFGNALAINHSAFTGLTLNRSNANGSSIDFNNSEGLLGRVGYLSNGSLAITNGTVGTSNMMLLTSGGNATFAGDISASNFSGTSSGTNTGDQDLSGYATLTGTNSFSGSNRFNTATNNTPVEISRTGSTSSQVLKIGVTDTVATFRYIEDTTSEGNGNFGTYQFNLEGNDGETAVNGLTITKTGISAPNFSGSSSGTNTGDQDLSGYLTTTGKAADAELLDGINSTSFLRSDASDTWSGDISTTSTNGIRFGSSNQTDTNDGYIAAGRFASGLNIVGTQTTAGTGRQVRIWGSLITDAGSSYWNGGNDGAGSGLDADLLDGQHASDFQAAGDYQPSGSYVTTNTTQTVPGAKTFSSNANHYSGHLYYDAYDANGNHYPHFIDGGLGTGVSVNWRLYQGSSELTHAWNFSNTNFSNSLRSNVDMRAPVFYDSDNTGYYLNPASSSKSAHLRGHVEIINEVPKLELNDFTATDTTNQLGYISYQQNGTETGWIGFGSGSNSYLSVTNNSGIVSINGTYTLHNASSRAPIFYDSNDTSYYLNPASTSNINILNSVNTNVDDELLFAITDYDTTESIIDKFGGSSGFSKVDDPDAPASGVFRVNGGVQPTFGPYMPMDDETEVIFECWAKHDSGSDTAGLLYAGSNFYDGSKTYYGNTQRYWGASSDAQDANDTGWRHIKGSFKGSEIRSALADASYFRFIVLFNYQSNGNATKFCGFKFYRSKKTVTSLRVKTGSNDTQFQTTEAATSHLVIDNDANVFPSSLLEMPAHSGVMKFRTNTHWESNPGIDFIGTDGEFRMSSDSGNLNLRVDGWVIGSESVRGPIFYDLNNTAYYVNPASTSVLDELNVKREQRWFRDASNNAHQRADARLDGSDQARLHWYGKNDADSTANFKHAWYDGSNYINVTAASSTVSFVNTGAGYTNVTADGTFRAPIFYDLDNTAYYLDPASTSNLNGITSQGTSNFRAKRHNFGLSSDWDAIGFGNATNLHMQGHNQFWIGAGNGTWFTGTANAKTQESGLAADASGAHDLLITTMQGTSTNDRGITFAVDTNGAGTDGWRLGKWHSSTSRAGSLLAVDGTIFAKGGYTDEYDYYGNDYSAYHASGKPAWAGDTNAGWHKPSLVASSAIHIQSGNASPANTRKPQIQFHQYGYGGPGIEYDGPNKTMTLGELGTSNPDRINTFKFRFDNTDRAIINSDYMFHNSDMRSPIFYDSNDTAYYGNFAGNSRYNTAQGNHLGLGTAAPSTTSGYRLSISDGGIDMNNNAINYVTQLHFNDNVRFYDEGNDSYLNFKYGDAATGGIKFLNGGGSLKGYIYGNGEGFGILDNDGNWAVKTQTGTSPLILHCDNNPEFYVYTSYTWSPGSSRAPIFYDSNNTAYYVNPSSGTTSAILAGSVGLGTTSPDLKLDVFSGYNNGIRIAGSESSTWLNLSIRPYVTQAQANALPDHTHIFTTNPSGQSESSFSKYGGTVIQCRNNGNTSFAIRMGDGTNWHVPFFINSDRTITCSSTVTATNFILSSDKTLKEDVRDLDVKVNAKWRSYKFKNEDETRYGVIAQELEETNPELVKTDEEGLKSVKYIDLLIAKIAELEARLEKLEK